jgi:hypothetical protein
MNEHFEKLARDAGMFSVNDSRLRRQIWQAMPEDVERLIRAVAADCMQIRRAVRQEAWKIIAIRYSLSGKDKGTGPVIHGIF